MPDTRLFDHRRLMLMLQVANHPLRNEFESSRNFKFILKGLVRQVKPRSFRSLSRHCRNSRPMDANSEQKTQQRAEGTTARGRLNSKQKAGGILPGRRVRERRAAHWHGHICWKYEQSPVHKPSYGLFSIMWASGDCCSCWLARGCGLVMIRFPLSEAGFMRGLLLVLKTF